MGQVVNVDSLLNYIATKSGVPIDIVKNWYPNYTTTKGRYALNVEAACLILRRARKIAFGGEGSYNNTSKLVIDTVAAKNLYNRIFNGCTWQVVSTAAQMVSGITYYVLQNVTSCGFDMMGAGGGGGGGASAKTDDKNGVANGKGGLGAMGSDTIVYINGENKFSVAGSEGGSGGSVSQDDSKGGWKSSGGSSGKQGHSGMYWSDFAIGDKLQVKVGNGGGGGGGSNAHFSKDGTGTGGNAKEIAGGESYGTGGLGLFGQWSQGYVHLNGDYKRGEGNRTDTAGYPGAGGSNGDNGGSAGNTGSCNITKNFYVNGIGNIFNKRLEAKIHKFYMEKDQNFAESSTEIPQVETNQRVKLVIRFNEDYQEEEHNITADGAMHTIQPGMGGIAISVGIMNNHTLTAHINRVHPTTSKYVYLYVDSIYV